MTQSRGGRAEWAVPVRGTTCLTGLFGWPVEHSMSPPMQNAAFASLGLDWCYVPFPVRPENVAEALNGARALGLKGLNATVPHKQALVPLMATLTDAARAVGAVNTVVFDEQRRMHGHNTDVSGFLVALSELLPGAQGMRALVLGAGGAARAVVYALLTLGADVTILNRTAAKASDLAEAMTSQASALPRGSRARGAALTSDELRTWSAGVDLVVNTTPVGMWPHTDESPWLPNVPLPEDAALMDLIYNPRETRLMAQAVASGNRVMGGLPMLVHQGADAFALWTGHSAPLDLMFQVCRQLLGGP